MKKIILFQLMLFSVYILQAQFNPMAPEVFLNMKVPFPPGEDKVCSSNAQQKTEFGESVTRIMEEAKEQITFLRRDEKKNAVTMQEQAKQKMQSDYGISEADMKKMQSGKMSKEEKKAMADKLLQQNYGISVDEAKDVSKMSKAGKTAWAEGFVEQQKAETEKDPKKNQETLEKNKQLYDMTQEKDLLSRKLTAQEEKFGQKLQELEVDSTAIQIRRDIAALTEKYMSMVGVDYGQGPEMEQIAGKIKSKKSVYCERLTPKYIEVLALYREAIKKNMPDYYRLEVLINEVNKMTSGSTVDMMQKGLIAYNAIEGYLTILHDAYKYSLYDLDQPF